VGLNHTAELEFSFSFFYRQSLVISSRLNTFDILPKLLKFSDVIKMLLWAFMGLLILYKPQSP
jgi:hypothetical protein